MRNSYILLLTVNLAIHSNSFAIMKHSKSYNKNSKSKPHNKNSKIDLSETLMSELASVVNDTFPDTFLTYTRAILLASDNPSAAQLLPEPNVDLTPYYFSSNPDDNLPNVVGLYTNTLTASSDPNILVLQDQFESKIIWGRQGSDTLIGFDPSGLYPVADGKRRIDIFVGDVSEEQIDSLLSSTPLPSGVQTQWPNTFILGDWREPYYLDNQKDPLGLNQYALIADFNKTKDTIQLHGNSQDYKLVKTSLGTAIFWQNNKNDYDLIGVVAGVDDLNLNGNYFSYKGNTAPEPVLKGAKQIGTAGIDYLFTSTVDAEGNLYVAGATTGSLFGPKLGYTDAWMTKYGSNGNNLWGKQFGTATHDVSSIASDGSNIIAHVWDIASYGSNIYAVGNTSTKQDGNPITIGGNDVYLAKYNSNDGKLVWIKQYGTVTGDESFKVSTDSSGNIYAAGHTLGSLPGQQNHNVGQDPTQIPSTDSFVTKFDSNGNQLWTSEFGTSALDDDWGVATDKYGNVFAGGNTLGNFGGPNAGAYDAWLVKLDQKDGHIDWVRQFGTPTYDFLWNVKTDSTGNVYASGWTRGDLGGKNAGDSDVWLAKYDTNGNQLWIKQFGTSGDDAPYLNGMDVDSKDNIFLAGHTNGNLGGKNAGSYDAWVAKYDKNGNQVWIKQFGTPEYDTSTAVSADSHGNLYVSGFTEGSLGATNAGSFDSWILKLNADNGQIEDFTGNCPYPDPSSCLGNHR